MLGFGPTAYAELRERVKTLRDKAKHYADEADRARQEAAKNQDRADHCLALVKEYEHLASLWEENRTTID